MRIFVAGGTGQIGSRLLPVLQPRGEQLVVLTRTAAKAKQKLPPLQGGLGGVDFVEGDPTKAGPWMEAVNGCQAVINLVGENVFAKRWNEDFKRVLRESRLHSTANIVAAILKASDRPAVLVQASAVGYYGFHGDEEITEDSPPSDDFLASICVDWENTARQVEQAGVRLVLVRTGIVLDPLGGALKFMLTPFKMILFGGRAGSGRQWVPWIHHADEVGIMLMALDNPQAQGPLNAVAPNPVTNQQLAKTIGAVLNRPSFMPTPGFLLRLGLGEVADVVLQGQRAVPKKALALGYQFQYPDLDAALRHLLAKEAATKV